MKRQTTKIRNGYVFIRGQKVIPPKERLMSFVKINKKTLCWEWQGALKGSAKLRQYGNLIIGSRTDKTRKTISAHRYAYQVFKGPIPKNLWVLHRCDNPRCINPEHLFLGDRKDNVEDRERKGRNLEGLKKARLARWPKELTKKREGDK